MNSEMKKILEATRIEASAPCRIDMGGTLDIPTFYLPLRHLEPCTFNIAIDLRTTVRLLPHDRGMIKISSKGFESAEFPMKKVPFSHPLGLMFAIASFFNARDIHIVIDSSSPPRSALGGSSSAAVALITAFSKLMEMMKPHENYSPKKTALLAHALEQSVAGVPCGIQDQLAAVYGGVNAWEWPADPGGNVFEQKTVGTQNSYGGLEKRILLAYCGVPHASSDVNGKWVRQFLAGQNRDLWAEIVAYTKTFIDALAGSRFDEAAAAMNSEVAIRRRMTPEVLDDVGLKLANAATDSGCGARFTGAGGGGCIWALGEPMRIEALEKVWNTILSERKEACLLDVKIASEGCK